MKRAIKKVFELESPERAAAERYDIPRSTLRAHVKAIKQHLIISKKLLIKYFAASARRLSEKTVRSEKANPKK